MSSSLQNEKDVNEARATLFRALGDATRIQIFQTLVDAEKPLNVSELCDRTDYSYNLVSHHLQCLHNCTLVAVEQEGRNRYYRVADETGARLLELADECLQQAGERVLQCEIAGTRTETGPDGD